MKLNLIMSSDPQRPLRITKSNNSGIIDVPYTMDNSSPLARYLEDHLPAYWNQALCDLHMQERAIIEERKALMAKFKASAIDICQPLIEQFKHEHPEHFI